jgi:hypothetical protein
VGKMIEGCTEEDCSSSNFLCVRLQGGVEESTGPATSKVMCTSVKSECVLKCNFNEN